MRTAAPLLALFCIVLAPCVLLAQVEDCPLGATEVDLTATFPMLDDGSVLYTVPTSVFPSGILFADTRWSEVWINVNGNVSFGVENPDYTPMAIPGLVVPTIAPFFADGDLRDSLEMTHPSPTNPGRVTVCEDAAGSRLLVTWRDVPFFDSTLAFDWNYVDTFQLVLAEPGVVCSDGGLDVSGLVVEFRYERLDWYVGISSGANETGTCEPDTVETGVCFPAVAGFDSGDGVTAVSIEGSHTYDVSNTLLNGSNVGTPGLYAWSLTGGSIPLCGNGELDACEECDDGPLNGAGPCSEECVVVSVGDADDVGDVGIDTGDAGTDAGDVGDAGDAGDADVDVADADVDVADAEVDVTDAGDADAPDVADAEDVAMDADDADVAPDTAPDVSGDATDDTTADAGSDATDAPLADVAGADRDEDGVPDELDNCPDTPNPEQRDRDNDGVGAECDDTDFNGFSLTGGGCGVARRRSGSVLLLVLAAAVLRRTRR